jgi:hypothetical protein
MSSNLPRQPVRFIQENQDLLKSQEGLAGQKSGSTDFYENEPYVHISGPSSTYRTPPDRMCGNAFFRRYLNGSLDLPYAVSKVIDALHRAKDSGGINQLNNEERTALNVLFPTQFSFSSEPVVDAIAMVQMKISMPEIELIRQTVAAHIQEELNYNAGVAGGSTPGRHQTRS